MTERKPREVDGLQTRDEYDWVCENLFDALRKVLPRKRNYGWVVSFAIWYHMSDCSPEYKKSCLEELRGRDRNLILAIQEILRDLRTRYGGVTQNLWDIEVLRAAMLLRATYLPGSMVERDAELMLRRGKMTTLLRCPSCKATLKDSKTGWSMIPGEKHARTCLYSRSTKHRLSQATPLVSQMKLTDFSAAQDRD